MQANSVFAKPDHVGSEQSEYLQAKCAIASCHVVLHVRCEIEPGFIKAQVSMSRDQSDHNRPRRVVQAAR